MCNQTTKPEQDAMATPGDFGPPLDPAACTLPEAKPAPDFSATMVKRVISAGLCTAELPTE